MEGYIRLRNNSKCRVYDIRINRGKSLSGSGRNKFPIDEESSWNGVIFAVAADCDMSAVQGGNL